MRRLAASDYWIERQFGGRRIYWCWLIRVGSMGQVLTYRTLIGDRRAARYGSLVIYPSKWTDDDSAAVPAPLTAGATTEKERHVQKTGGGCRVLDHTGAPAVSGDRNEDT